MTAARASSLADLQRIDSLTTELPGDASTENVTRQVNGAFFTFVQPTPADGDPSLLAASPGVAALLGLDAAALAEPEFLAAMSGKAVPPGWRPWAQCYGGHQFGNWAGQLGDGRAISLAEVQGRDSPLELQLKGAGVTPYSRRADGRAVLRSSVREFVASEAMAALGVPTTRALALVATGDGVVRDMFYDGRARMEPGAVVCRISRSFVRFGTFQLPASRGDDALVQKLVDYALRHCYPHLSGPAAMLREVCERTARLAAGWQAVGFVHGVLNTDNCSILGETIDYGPYGWMEAYDPQFTPNTTDMPGLRYCYAQQPHVLLWNVAQLANALLSAGILPVEEAQAAIDAYGPALQQEYSARFAAKLGMKKLSDGLLRDFMALLARDKLDFTRAFRSLVRVPAAVPGDTSEADLLAPLAGVLPADMARERSEAWVQWVGSYRSALAAEGMDPTERTALQNGANPMYVPRNYLLQLAIEGAEKGDLGYLNRLVECLKRPYEEQPGCEAFDAAAPAWALRPGVSCLSCSS